MSNCVNIYSATLNVFQVSDILVMISNFTFFQSSSLYLLAGLAFFSLSLFTVNVLFQYSLVLLVCAENSFWCQPENGSFFTAFKNAFNIYVDSGTKKLVETALNALGEYPMEVEIQLSNNKGITPGLNFPDGNQKDVLSYFKTEKANQTKAQQQAEAQQKIEVERQAKAEEELQAKQVAYKNNIIQIILCHLLRMLN